jgi:hypothetical protein
MYGIVRLPRPVTEEKTPSVPRTACRATELPATAALSAAVPNYEPTGSDESAPSIRAAHVVRCTNSALYGTYAGILLQPAGDRPAGGDAASCRTTLRATCDVTVIAGKSAAREAALLACRVPAPLQPPLPPRKDWPSSVRDGGGGGGCGAAATVRRRARYDCLASMVCPTGTKENDLVFNDAMNAESHFHARCVRVHAFTIPYISIFMPGNAHPALND